MKKKFTIKDLAEGRCAVINDGTLEELRRVLKKAFPYAVFGTEGHAKYYFQSNENPKDWEASYILTDMEAQSVKDFLPNEYPKIMEVSNYPKFPKEATHKRVVFMEKNGKYLTWSFAETFEEAEKAVSVGVWDYARDIEDTPKIEITVKINGKKVKLSDISEETLLKIINLDKK